MDPPALAAVVVAAASPQQRRRRGSRFAEWTFNFTISFVILSLLKLEPLARNSVQDHNSEIDLPLPRLQSSLAIVETKMQNDDIPEISPLHHFVPLPFPAEVPDFMPPIFHEWNSTNSTPPSVWFDALDTYGHRGYIADPTLLRRSLLQWHKDHPHATYWDRLQKYQSHLLKKTNSSSDVYKALYMEESCKQIPGISLFNQGGLAMLTERIKVDKTPTIRMGGKDCLEQEDTPDDGNNNATKKKLKLFCGVYTYDGKRDFVRVAALSYGLKCDGFLAFSTATIPSLGMVALLHRGEEMYQNMFQKTRSILSYVATHYLDDYDYFHLGGDDMYIIVENFRSLMLEYETEGYSGTKQGRIFGQLAIKPKAGNVMFSGGPGYTFDRVGLKKLHDFMPKCNPNKITYSEDGEITRCVRNLNLEWSDNRDKCTGQQRSFDEIPDVVYSEVPGKGTYNQHQWSHWANLEHPTIKGEKVGVKIGLDAASNHTVVFHRLRYPIWMTRHHALIYRACDASTPLGNLTDISVDESISAGGA